MSTPPCSACELWRDDDAALVHMTIEAVTYRTWFLSALEMLADQHLQIKTLERQMSQFLGATPMHPEMNGDSLDHEPQEAPRPR